jgi:hypothetical protein
MKVIQHYEMMNPKDIESLKFYKQNFLRIKKRNMMESFGYYKTL